MLLMPGVMALSFGILRVSGTAIPSPQFSAATALALLAVFFVAALGEELGWSGYITDPMQHRWGALAQADRSAVWIAACPIQGSYYDPRITSLIIVAVAMIVTVAPETTMAPTR